MEFSSKWRSPWIISSSFSAPALLLPSPELGPLLFFPSPRHPPSTMLSSPSLHPQLPPPSSHNGIPSFLRSFPFEFVPTATAQSLPPVSSPLLLPNSLVALPSRDRSALFLFLPLGDNAHRLGYFAISSPHPHARHFIGDLDGDVFDQSHGFRHPSHRIIHISVRAADPDSADHKLQGYLLAVTMYSVNWFRVESANDARMRIRPVLVPMSKQGFAERVVHACWNPHFVGESAVLLESGKVAMIDLDAGRGFTVDASMQGRLGEPLSCEFGGQPWNLIVAGSNCVVMVDLRLGDCGKPSVLARIDCSNAYFVVHSMEDDTFVAFCRAEFDPPYFAVVTKYHLLLFDVRQPLCPLLTWDHGITGPSYIGMYRLSDLRSSEGDSGVQYPEGYAILVGSLWEDEFKMFCYGPGEEGFDGLSFRAWDLPSRICLSGLDGCTGDDVLEEELFKDDVPEGIDWQEKKDLLLGFYICPRGYWNSDNGCEETNGFELIRLVSSGKIELQKYCVSWDKSGEESCSARQPLTKADVSLFRYLKDVDFPPHHMHVMKLNFVKAYMNDDLCEALVKGMNRCQVYGQESKGIEFNSVLWELIRDTIPSLDSKLLTDVTFPSSMLEIACRSVLVTPRSSLLYLTFSRYRDLFNRSDNLALEFFEVPESRTRKKMPPLLTGFPSRRSSKWSQKVRPGDALLGPIIPLPVVLMLEQILNGSSTDSKQTQSAGELLSDQCEKVRKNFFPEISLADDADFTNPKDENSFFTHEVLGGTASQLTKDNGSSGTFQDKNFTTFVIGVHKIKGREPLERACISDLFDDLSMIKVHYCSPDVKFSADEERVYKCLGKQFLKWQGKFLPYQDFCSSTKTSGGIM